MMRVLSVGVLLVLLSLPALAGKYLMNDTGQTVYGLTVTFSELVAITGFGDVLMAVDPVGESAMFTFAGGKLDAWGGHWLNWEPDSAVIVAHQWLLSPSASQSSNAWEAFPRQVDWLTTVQVPAFQVPADLADSTFVTTIAWGSSWQMESSDVASLPEDTERLMDSGRPYTMGFSPITTSERAFFNRPELADAACIDIDGGRCILEWYPVGTLSPFYWGCTNNPVWQDYLIERCTRAVDLGVDAILLDEIYGTAHATWNAGGCFCEYCMAGFRDYLSEKYTAAELRREYEISDVPTFDYGDYIRDHDYVDDWKSRQFWSIPLYGDYQSFQNQAVVEAMRHVVEASRQYASEVYDRYLPFSANINDLNTAGLKFADLLDWFTCEAFYKDLGYPPSAKMAPLARLAAGFGKSAYFMTNITTNADLIKQASTDNLLRLLIADAYAGGGAYYLPYNIHAYDETTGTSPGSFTGELDEIAYYYRFVLDNPFLFRGTTTGSSITLLYPFSSIEENFWNPAHEPFFDLSAALYDALLPYNVLVVGDSECIRQSPSQDDLAMYSYVIIPLNSQLPYSVTRDLADFINNGGRVLTYSESIAAAIRNAGGSRSGIVVLHRVPEGYFRDPNESVLSQMLSEMPSDVLQRRIEISDRSTDRVKDCDVCTYRSDGALAIHVVNYNYEMGTDSVSATGPVTLTLPIEYLGSDLTETTAYLLSPELPLPERVSALRDNSHVKVQIPEVGIWTAVCFITAEKESQLLAETLEQLPHLACGFSVPGNFTEPVQLSVSDLMHRQEVLDAAWQAIEEGRPSADNVAWESLSPCLTFPAVITPGFYCNGVTDFAEAQFWGRSGHEVHRVNVGLSDEGLAISVQLHPNDHVGSYGYIIAFRSGSTSFYAMLTPDETRASLSLDENGRWQDIGNATGDLYQQSLSEVRAWFPAEIFREVVEPSSLIGWSIDFHIDYREGGRRELFFFPGSGHADSLE